MDKVKRVILWLAVVVPAFAFVVADSWRWLPR